METRAFLGLDIGGTSVKGMRLEADGRITGRAALPTPQGEGAEAVLRTVAAVLGELSMGGRVTAVGMGTPGAVDSAGRVVAEAVNIPGWRGTDLRSAAADIVHAPVTVRNDGNLAAYGEWASRQRAECAVSRGAKATPSFREVHDANGEPAPCDISGGRVDARNLLFVGLGTGIGGGYIEDGRILGGTDDRAVELGHVVIRAGGRLCACGRRGCVEAYASGPAIGSQAEELAPSFDTPFARRIKALGSGSDANHVTARDVYEAFALGDALALAVHREVAEALAQGVAVALALLAPDTVVLGGGVLAGGGALVADVAARVPEYVYPAAVRDCRFEAALLGPEAGLIGAALYGASQVLDREALVALSEAVSTGRGKSSRS